MTDPPAEPAPPPASRTVVWFELWVPDPVRAKEFYGAMFGWRFRPMPEYDEQYWLIEGSGLGGALLAGDTPAGGAEPVQRPVAAAEPSSRS